VVKNFFLKIVFQVMLFNVNSSLHYSLSIILHMDVYTLRMTQIHTPRSYTPFFLIPKHMSFDIYVHFQKTVVCCVF